MHNPYEEIYDTVMGLSKKCGYDTFDYLPDSDQSYPFVFVGEQVNTDEYTKDRVLGQTNLLVHVYADQTQRKKVAAILENLLRTISMYRGRTPNFYYRVMDSNTRITGETANSLQLWHGILEMDIKYY